MPRKKSPKKSRAPRGEGSVFPDRRRGGYVGKVPVGRYPNGRTKYVQVSGATHAEVVAKKKRVAPPDPDTVTVAEWVARWTAGLSNRASTKAVYAHSVNSRVVPSLGHVRLKDLTVSQVKAAAQTWVGPRTERKLAPQTVNLTLDRAATMFAAAVVDGLVNSNPFALCPRLEFTRKPIDPFAPGELRAIIAAWQTARCGPLFAFLAATGCREGEATALDVTDYDSLTAGFSITKTYNPKFGTGPPKSRRGVRALDVPADLPVARAAVAHARGSRTRGPLFATATGKRIDHAQIYVAFAALLKRLGLRKRSPHKMRHGVATALISARVPIGDVAKWMGDTEEMIVRTYLHPSGADVSAALGRILGG